MSRQEIRVTFNPDSTNDDSFSFSPERAVLDEQTSVVDLILHTVGGNGSKARFAEADGVIWITPGPQDLEEDVDPSRTVLSLRGFPRNETQGTINYGYGVTVEYEGATLSSGTAQYPDMSCVPNGGG